MSVEHPSPAQLRQSMAFPSSLLSPQKSVSVETAILFLETEQRRKLAVSNDKHRV